MGEDKRDLDPGAFIGREPDGVDDEGPDASDVVKGPVGDAALRDPATNPDMGADLAALPGVETEPDD